MKKLLNLMTVASIIVTAMLSSSCEKEYAPGEFTMFIYGVGDEDITYRIAITATGDGVDQNKAWADEFNNRGYGVGRCGNYPEDISGQYTTDNRAFVLQGLRCHCSYTIQISIDGQPDILFTAPHITNWNGETVWVNVSEQKK